MDLERLDRIKKLVIVAMFSDDEFMDELVLKGGNAIDLIHGVAMRGSIDLDFSMESDFPQDCDTLRNRFEKLLNETLRPEGFAAFDVRFTARPSEVSADLRDFWGGYRLEFKITDKVKLQKLSGSPRNLRVSAEDIAPGHLKTLSVDISRFEYCAPKSERELDGFTIYVYTPEMIVCEKLRAICQQMQVYRDLVRSPSASARAKDFFDIYVLVEHYGIDLSTTNNKELLKRMFQVKRVAVGLLGSIESEREFHRAGFASVTDTVKLGVDLKTFDVYFDFVVDLANRL